MPPPGPRRPSSRYGYGGFPYRPQPTGTYRPLAPGGGTYNTGFTPYNPPGYVPGLYSTGTGTYNPYAIPLAGLRPPTGTRPTVATQSLGGMSQGARTRAVAKHLKPSSPEGFKSWIENLIGFLGAYSSWEEGGRSGKPPSAINWRDWVGQVGVQQQGSSWQQGLVTQRY